MIDQYIKTIQTISIIHWTHSGCDGHKLRPLLEEQLDDLRLVRLRCQVDRFLPVVVGWVQRGAQLKEEGADGLLAGRGGQVQGCLLFLYERYENILGKFIG